MRPDLAAEIRQRAPGYDQFDLTTRQAVAMIEYSLILENNGTPQERR